MNRKLTDNNLINMRKRNCVSQDYLAASRRRGHTCNYTQKLYVQSHKCINIYVSSVNKLITCWRCFTYPLYKNLNGLLFLFSSSISSDTLDCVCSFCIKKPSIWQLVNVHTITKIFKQNLYSTV